jgi:methylenetetrahydrofolate dehydrogenase (NADP+) / methenyltetrahydrofolate cyclohydrolase
VKKLKKNRLITAPYVQEIKEELKEKIKIIKDEINIVIIQVGNNYASNVYIKNKIKFCNEVGINTIYKVFDQKITETELIDYINIMNKNSEISGIMVQLPLPSNINKRNVLDAISFFKDIDGLSSKSIQALWTDQECLKPCTALAIVYLMKKIEKLDSKHAVILNDSDILGKPLSKLLLNEKMTVSICNKYTKNLNQITALADFVISGAGTPFLLDDSMIKDGAVVIDVSINKNEDGTIIGDASKLSDTKAKIVTAVPGGVGPLTVSFLALNSLEALKFKK